MGSGELGTDLRGSEVVMLCYKPGLIIALFKRVECLVELFYRGEVFELEQQLSQAVDESL